ncbi:hypothetical protein [Micromonospora sp. WMMD964]|uniref:hypothetical protein n=1 Tax=Micromonospora sp. WMMD964 TaxID=3016091 RepID=UPI002499EFD1|nr:hypothetical protein [Micromonospora sp. WMMD964]WFF02910.1 hypothetical protein O7616_09240 [Micromonospora sp. WMMD964]
MTGPEARLDGAPTTLSWLCHPTTLLALVLLLVNDHVWKPAFPGLLTGKLSDVAGLVLAPPLVAVLLTLLVPRMPARIAAVAGLVAVGAGFAMVKSNGYAAELASSAWTVLAGPSLVRADWTDLLTLPALGLASWSWTRARERPVRQRAARVARMLVVLPPALLAVAATSAVWYPYALGTAMLDGKPAISVGSGYSSQNWPTSPSDGVWAVSDSGAATWRAATVDEQQRLNDQDSPRRQGCAPDDSRRCYRVVTGHLRVEQSDDAGVTWRVAWEVPDGKREALARQSDNPGDIGRHFASRELIVHPLAGGGHEVLVANGRDGFLRRLPDGEWQRDGFLFEGGRSAIHWEDPPSLDGSSPRTRTFDLLLAVVLAVSLGALVVLVASSLAVRRAGGGIRWGLVGALPMLLSGLALSAFWPRADDFVGVSFMLAATLAVGIAPAVVVSVRAWYQGATTRWVGWTLAGLVFTVLLAGVPLIGWVNGNPPDTRSAVSLALLATVPGLVLAVLTSGLVDPTPTRGRRNKPPYLPSPPYPPPYAPHPHQRVPPP